MESHCTVSSPLQAATIHGDRARRRPLRVCHITYSFFESDNRVMRYVQALAGRGDYVDVLSLRAPGLPWMESSGSVRLHRIQRRTPSEKQPWTYLLKILWFCLKSAFAVSVLQLRHRYDVVHVHNIPDFLVFVTWLPKLMGAAVILDVHDLVPELYAGKFLGSQDSVSFRVLRGIERASCAFADHVIVANHLWRDRLVSRSVSSTRCVTIMNYPDLTLFKPLEQKSRSPYVILYPGTLNHHQGVDIAIRAFAQVKAEMPDAEFHIYGRGPALPELMRLARDCGVTECVKFNGSRRLTEIALIMAGASVGVVPKRADGFGNEAFSTKTLEFMACGVPLIVARTRIDSHYFCDDIVRFFEPGNQGALAQALLEMYRSRDSQAQRVSAGRVLASQYAWHTHRGDYLNLVDELAMGSWPAKQPKVLGSR